MPQSVERSAFAKVNLFLDVLGRRPDDYHTLLTLFERINLKDELTLEKRPVPGITLTCDDPSLSAGEDNLIVQAVRGYLALLGQEDEGIGITLKKRIPMGAGLGGGSSNAAAALLGLQDLFGNPLPKTQLIPLAQKLGADVPFFLADIPWGLGQDRGDVIEPLDLPGRWVHLLVRPPFSIPTGQIYSVLSLTGVHPDVTLLTQALKTGEVSRVQALLYNALEPAVDALFPDVLKIRETLRAVGLKKPMVSGSGSVVFSVCADEAEALCALEMLEGKRSEGWRFFVSTTQV